GGKAACGEFEPRAARRRTLRRPRSGGRGGRWAGRENRARRSGTARHRAAGSSRRRARRLPTRRRLALFFHAPFFHAPRLFHAPTRPAQARLPAVPHPDGRRTRTDPCACHATTLTILCGTTITFFGGLPSSARFTASRAKTAVSISALAAFRATVTSPRFLPLIWIGSVIVFSTRRSASSCGQGSDATSVL